ncbi:MAG TPA: M1 family aminopeptidase [Gemmatimonadaceae bacterium]|nr:M1 family aminopeptidase [Gemmatimonadaceae bacterium]
MTTLRWFACAAVLCGCFTHRPAIDRISLTDTGDVTTYAGYIGDVAIDQVSGKLSARWSIGFFADSATGDSVVLLLNRGLVVSRVVGENVAGYSSGTRDGDQTVTVRFAHRLAPGTRQVLDVDYSGVPVFGSDSINRISPNWVELGLDSYWLPVFADYRKRISGQVWIDLPPRWNAVTSGKVTRDANGRLVITTGIPLIDVAFTASPTFNHTDAQNTSVFWTKPDSATVSRVVTTAQSCRDYLNRRYGVTDTIPAVRLVLAPRSGPGYARRNYIVLTDAASTPAPALAGYICHEFAHFWSSNAISSGPENWLNEAMAEYVSSRYVRATYGQAAYDSVVARWQRMSANQPPIWTPQSVRRPSAQVAYRKAPFLLSRLEQRIGAEKMDTFLKRYMVERIRTTPELLAALQDVAGAETESWFREELAR